MRKLHFNQIYHAALKKNADLLPAEDCFIDEFEQGSMEMTAAAKLASEGNNDAAKWLVEFRFTDASHAAYGAALAGDEAFVEWLRMRYNAKSERILAGYAEGGHFSLIADFYGLERNTINLTGPDIETSEVEAFIEDLKTKDDEVLPILVKAIAKSSNHRLIKTILETNPDLTFPAILGSILGQQNQLANDLLNKADLTDTQKNKVAMFDACANGFNARRDPRATVYGLYGLAMGGHWNDRATYACSNLYERCATIFHRDIFSTAFKACAIAGGHDNVVGEAFVEEASYVVIRMLKDYVGIGINHLQYCNFSEKSIVKVAELTFSNEEAQLHFLTSNTQRSITKKLLSKNLVSQETKEAADNIKQGMKHYSYFIAKKIVTYPRILRFLMSVIYMRGIANPKEEAENTTWGLLPFEVLCLVLDSIFDVHLKTNEIGQLLFSTKKLVIGSALCSYNKKLSFFRLHKKQRAEDLISATHSASNSSELNTVIGENKNHKDAPIKSIMQRFVSF